MSKRVWNLELVFYFCKCWAAVNCCFRKLLGKSKNVSNKVSTRCVSEHTPSTRNSVHSQNKENSRHYKTFFASLESKKKNPHCQICIIINWEYLETVNSENTKFLDKNQLLNNYCQPVVNCIGSIEYSR